MFAPVVNARPSASAHATATLCTPVHSAWGRALKPAQQKSRKPHAASTVRARAKDSVIHPVTFDDGSSTAFSPLLNGTWTLAGGHGRIVVPDMLQVMKEHVKRGLTTFDTADIYGPSERILGLFVTKCDAEGIPPPQIFTKFVPNIFRNTTNAQFVNAAIRQSIDNLRVDKLDLIQLHWWDYEVPGMVDAALHLADLQAQGLITSIGTTNLNVEALSKIVNAGVKVASNQVQFSLVDRRPLNGMVQYCKAHKIKLLTYGSLAGGLLSDKYFVQPAVNSQAGDMTNKYPPLDLNTSSLKMYWGSVQEFGGVQKWQDLLAVLHQVAQKHRVTIANVALRWVMDQGEVYPIIGMRSTAHIDDNLSVLSLALDDRDREIISNVLAGSRKPQGDIYSRERMR
eukprot:jgi/Mesvir1/13511/Mv06306-RA.1